MTTISTDRTGMQTASALLAVATTSIAVFLLPAMELLRINREYFVAGFADGTYLYLAGLAVFLAGAVAWMVRRSPVARVAFWFVVLSGPAWLLYSVLGLLAPRTGVFVGLATVVVLGSVAVTVLGTDDLQRRIVARLGWIGLAMVLYLAFSAALTATTISDAGPAVAQDVSASGASELPNAYHLVLDEFQTDVFEAIRDDDLDAALRGFTFFPDALTEYGRTEMALASVFGLDPYRYDRPMDAYQRDAFSGPRSLLTALEDGGYVTHGYLHERRQAGGDPSPFDWSVLHAEQAPSHVSSDKRRLAVSVWAFAHLPAPLAGQVMPASHEIQLEGESLLPEDAPPISVASFRSLIEDEARRPASGQYVLGHFILPHFPSVMEEDCAYEEGVLTGVVSQSRCAMLLVERFLSRLESLGRFENSLIVIHGDHGGRYVRDGDRVGSVETKDVFSEEFSRARSRPVLLLKPPGVARTGAPPLRSVPHPALLSDVSATIHATLGLAPRFRPAGSSLLDPDFPDRPARYYHFYDKHRSRFISGPLHRYRVTDDDLELDARIEVPTS
ncbi:MAG: hypothetical protein KY461_06785 [Actinobacteria bacterium]|nr:hypothetical protein [Actinomycetota bacterium]